jgi:hypothetical protein
MNEGNKARSTLARLCRYNFIVPAETAQARIATFNK